MSATAFIPSAGNRPLHLRPCGLPSLSGRLMVLKRGDWCSASRRTALQLARRNARRPLTKLRVVMDGSVLPGASPPPPPNFPVWAGWVLGSLAAIIIPMLKLKGGFFLNLGKKIDQVVDTVEDVAEAVEDVAEVVEDVAEAVENAASDVADHLPAGEMRDAALWIENASKEVKEDAGKAKDFVDMVDDLTEEVEQNVETVMDSIDEKKEEEEVLQKAAKVELKGQTENKATAIVEQGKKEQVENVTGQRQTFGQAGKDAKEKAQPVRDAVEVRQP